MKQQTVWYEIGEFFGVVIAHRDQLRERAREAEVKSDALAVLTAAPGRTAIPGVIAVPQDQQKGELVAVRDELRRHLKELEGTLGMALTEREKYFALFPIVIYVDEILRTTTHGASETWESLQSELYGIDNGGERFYSILEELMSRGETHPIVFEVFYFCLNHGFKGLYAGEPTAARIDAVLERLALRIPTAPPDEPRSNYVSAQVQVHSFPWQYYVASASVLVGTYGLLRFVGYVVGDFK